MHQPRAECHTEAAHQPVQEQVEEQMAQAEEQAQPDGETLLSAPDDLCILVAACYEPRPQGDQQNVSFPLHSITCTQPSKLA
jgi:hypothetical protein